MAKLISLKLDVNKITKSKLFKGEKGTYLDLTIALNDEKDQYGNDVSVWEKCEKEETKNYLGNGKVFWSNDAQPQQTQQASQAAQKIVDDFDDDLPW